MPETDQQIIARQRRLIDQLQKQLNETELELCQLREDASRTQARLMEENERLRKMVEQTQAAQTLFLNESMALGALDDCARKHADAEQREKRLRGAIEGIFANPWGCPSCDSGVLRNPEKGHDEDCPFEVARRAALHPEAGSE